jgi:hypothetical protein
MSGRYGLIGESVDAVVISVLMLSIILRVYNSDNDAMRLDIWQQTFC